MPPQLRRQRGLQWALLLIALVLLVALIRSWRLGGTGAERTDRTLLLRKGEGASVIGFTLRRPDGNLRLARDEGRWRLVAPVEDLAAERMVREMLRSLEQLEVLRLLETAERAPYGLSAPQSELVLRRLDGDSLTIAIGDVAPSASAHYATWDGLGGVALIPSFIVNRFFLSAPFSWRERELLAPGGPIDSVHVASAGFSFRARRTGGGHWELLDVPGREADDIAFERAASSLWRSPYVDFYDDPAAAPDLGLDAPRTEWIVFRGSDVDTLRIGRRLEGGEMVVQAAGRPAGRAGGELYELLAGGLEALEVRTLIRGTAADVDRLLILTRSEGRYHVKRGDLWLGAPVSGEHLRALAGSLLADGPGGPGPSAAPDTAGWGAPFVADPSLDGDLHNLFEMRGRDWASVEGEAPPAGDRSAVWLLLWGANGLREWVRFTPTGGKELAESAASGEGVAIGSRFPERPMWLDSALLTRMARRAGRPPASGGQGD
ncbi:MAG: DUF4340 domain-containing protein [Candidatus Eisenbacteria bacterium]